MSTVPTVTTWDLPVPAARITPRTRRWLLLALAAALIAATAGYLAYRSLRTETASATARSAELDAARARALARASAQAKARLAVATKPALLGRNRVADSASAADLFARHSWYVPPPPPPPARAEPPPPPTAPPFPYTILGSYAPAGAPAVYFLARGDRVVDAHVGDRLDGVYELKSAANGQLTFNYLPLNIEQALSIGAPQ